jgi:CBS domain-containing protein
MNARELIATDLPAIQPGATVESALATMEQFQLDSLPVVKGAEIVGMLPQRMLVNAPDELAAIPQKHDLIQTAIYEDHHLFEILKVAEDSQLDVLPVLNESNEYVGSINMQALAAPLSAMLGAHVPGGVIVLSVDVVQYSLSEISRLIESENTRIVSSFIEADSENPAQIKVTLKLNKPDLTRVVATLERFSYTIQSVYHDALPDSEDSERLDALFRYLQL